MYFSSIEEILIDIDKGKFIIIYNKHIAYLVISADKVTSKHIDFLVKNTKGNIFISSEKEITTSNLKILFELQNKLLKNSVDKIRNVVPLVLDESNDIKDYVGNISKVFKSVGLTSIGIICEISKSKLSKCLDLSSYMKNFNLKIISLKSIFEYIVREEKYLNNIETASMPTKFGDFKITAFENFQQKEHHVAVTKGIIENTFKPILVRIHSECLTGDIFHSLRCDCGEQLEKSLDLINKEGSGIVLYMRQEGRGIGIINKVKAYKLQDNGKNTIEANTLLGFPPDMRNYSICAQMLLSLGVRKVKLITNNLEKVNGLKRCGIDVIERIPIITKANNNNKFYLDTKREKMGHLID